MLIDVNKSKNILKEKYRYIISTNIFVCDTKLNLNKKLQSEFLILYFYTFLFNFQIHKELLNKFFILYSVTSSTYLS